MASLKYKIIVEVETDLLDDSAGFNAVLSYIIQNQIKSIPGTIETKVTEITTEE